MSDITEQPYSEWLEEALHDLVDLQPVSIGFVMILPDGATATKYYNADTRDITIFREAFGIDHLSMVFEANIDNIKRLLEEGET
jgi:hypothetical protein